MSQRNRVTFMAQLAMAGVVILLAPIPVASQRANTSTTTAATNTEFKTPWGDPDLQGIWSYASITPLERPAELAGREFLTEEEVAEQNSTDARRASSERRSELTPEGDLRLAYNQVWWDRGTSTGRTSLIVDPPDGRLPPLTPWAKSGRRSARSTDAHTNLTHG